MGKCDSCKNKGTAWCCGCEHRQPGLEQFGFYQAQKKDEEKGNG